MDSHIYYTFFKKKGQYKTPLNMLYTEKTTELSALADAKIAEAEKECK